MRAWRYFFRGNEAALPIFFFFGNTEKDCAPFIKRNKIYTDGKKKRMWVWEENVEKLKRGKRGLKPILAIIMKRPNDLYAKKGSVGDRGRRENCNVHLIKVSQRRTLRVTRILRRKCKATSIKIRRSIIQSNWTSSYTLHIAVMELTTCRIVLYVPLKVLYISFL